MNLIINLYKHVFNKIIIIISPTVNLDNSWDHVNNSIDDNNLYEFYE